MAAEAGQEAKHTAHTPGPWVVSTDRERRDIIARDRVVATAGNMGCAIGYPQSERRPHVQRAQADARLIAAAPEMYEALKALEPHLDAIICYASSMDEHEPNRLAFNARAAIAKAEANG